MTQASGNSAVPTRTWRRKVVKIWGHLGAVFYNMIGTHIPSHFVRLALLRAWGARIGRDSSVFRGVQVFDIHKLRIGMATTIGFRCLLDGRSTLEIGDHVIVASDVHFLPGGHDVNSPDFADVEIPIKVDDYAWIASRATVLGSRIGRGAVVAACALVVADVPSLTIVGGVPATTIGVRDEAALQYPTKYRPPLY